VKDWIPFLQSLVWPLFLVSLVLWFRAGVRTILGAIGERIGSGASFEAGLAGVKVGAVQAPPGAVRKAPDTRAVDDLPHTIYMTHQAVRDPTLDHSGLQYYRLRIALDADEPDLLDDVEKVLYHLHPTFRDPDREVADRHTSFEIRTAAWGEFNMTCEIFFHDGNPKLVVERYINFLPVPA
jgi:hypothetical protein